jgi:squalene-hopene/tetraprenyl-beta-curcumene cyclase
MRDIVHTAAVHNKAAAAAEQATGALWTLQRPDGSWKGTLASSPVATGAVLIALHVIDRRTYGDLIDEGVRWLCQAQRADGGWGDTGTGPSTMNGTAIAVAALQLVGRADARRAVAAGWRAIERQGGRAAIEDLTRCSLGIVSQHFLYWAGLWPHQPEHRIPFEVILLPRRLRRKMSFTMPPIVAYGAMQARERQSAAIRRLIDRRAERASLRFLAELQEYAGPDGSFEESAFVSAAIAAALFRAGLGDDIVSQCLDYIVATGRPDGSWPVDRDLELSVTSYVTRGMQQGGHAADPRLRGTLQWIKDCQHRTGFAVTGCPPGGWGWARPSAWPDTDDTALAVETLTGFGLTEADTHLAAGADWLRAMQDRRGSWSCFIRNGIAEMDGPCAVLTAHAVTALASTTGRLPPHTDPLRSREIGSALRWLARAQLDDGSYTSQWFRGRTAGTARVLAALARLGLSEHRIARGCRAWLAGNQQRDGGWGDGETAGSSVEETSWALLGLLAAGGHDLPQVADGVRWLTSRQRADGLWQASEVGVYFPGLRYWCDHMANGYALQALSVFCTGMGEQR